MVYPGCLSLIFSGFHSTQFVLRLEVLFNGRSAVRFVFPSLLTGFPDASPFPAFLSSSLPAAPRYDRGLLFNSIRQAGYFSIRMRASTANKPRGVATNGLMSISLISLAKRSKVERRTIISAYCCSSMPAWPRVPLMMG